MEESTTYQAILEEGALRQARKSMLRLGQLKFHRAPKAVKTGIENITDLVRLEELLLRLLDATSWQELLDLPQPRRRKANS